MTLRIISLIAIGWALLSGEALAAGAFVVDDAGIVDPHKIQNENWITRTAGGTDVSTVNLAYQFFDDVELMLQGSHTREDGDHDDSLSPQLKYVWYENKTDGVASAIMFGLDRTFDTPDNSNYYLNVPVTISPTSALDLNVNLGYLYAQEDSRHFLTWGLGSEYKACDTVTLAAEIFGNNEERAGFQLGPRIAITDAALLDIIYGRDVYGESKNTFTAGLTLTF